MIGEKQTFPIQTAIKSHIRSTKYRNCTTSTCEKMTIRIELMRLKDRDLFLRAPSERIATRMDSTGYRKRMILGGCASFSSFHLHDKNYSQKHKGGKRKDISSAGQLSTEWNYNEDRVKTAGFSCSRRHKIPT